jgi:hypothetical protein
MDLSPDRSNAMPTTTRAHRTMNRQQHQVVQMIADRMGREQRSLAIIFRGLKRLASR